jgi:hypothetical protein
MFREFNISDVVDWERKMGHFHCSYMYNCYNYLEPCALNAEFQHFIPRFNKTSLLCGPRSKRGIEGEKRPKYRVKTG